MSITLYLAGGLGNQMFQYAAAKALALRRGTELVIDLRFFMKANEPAKAYRLNEFSISDHVIDYTKQNRPSPHGPFGRAMRILSGAKSRTYTESHLGYDPRVVALPDNSILVGNFQSPLFFSDCKRQILDIFERKLGAAGGNDGAIHVHVRRGDYLQHTGFALKNPLAYYSTALDRAYAERPGSRVRVFSDDVAWCRQQSIFEGAEFVGPQPDVSPLVDLERMARCTAIIIGNSSYSWWAGYLAAAQKKQVYCPDTWIGGLDAAKLDLYPSEWSIVPCAN